MVLVCKNDKCNKEDIRSKVMNSKCVLKKKKFEKFLAVVVSVAVEEDCSVYQAAGWMRQAGGHWHKGLRNVSTR